MVRFLSKQYFSLLGFSKFFLFKNKMLFTIQFIQNSFYFLKCTPCLPAPFHPPCELSHSGSPWPVGSEEPLGLAIEKYLADTTWWAEEGRNGGRESVSMRKRQSS